MAEIGYRCVHAACRTDPKLERRGGKHPAVEGPHACLCKIPLDLGRRLEAAVLKTKWIENRMLEVFRKRFFLSALQNITNGGDRGVRVLGTRLWCVNEFCTVE